MLTFVGLRKSEFRLEFDVGINFEFDDRKHLRQLKSNAVMLIASTLSL